MALIKCKMCGGELKILPDSTICECEYCGSKQTIPNTDDEKRLKLYERANKLRFENEFDKAAGVYESIVAEYQDEAEAYWGLVLCKYGIEYVDDPKTGKKIPTCHRSSFDSVMDDSNFDLVMENSDTVARSIYREEAKQIEELRKGIVEVSSKEEPYDIFICYKETADDGQRTIDSVIAQDVYQELTDKGYRVFFSRITLEDKLGQEYEPYIFAALNSAKVMLAFGTCYDYYNAVWVKNEWSRFLQLMEAGQKKTLIPCFKDIDAYDMPKEFARLQAQDMGKVGATQDLLRGIDKIFGRDRKQVETTAVLKTSGDSNATVKRGYFALEDGEWEKAIQYFDQAMNSDPENAEIHLGLFLAKRKCSNLDDFFSKQVGRFNTLHKKSILVCKPNEDYVEKVCDENRVDGYLSKKEISDLFLYKLTYDSIVDSLENEKSVYSDKDWSKVERFAKGDLEVEIKSIKNKHLDEISRRIEEEKNKDAINCEKIKKEYEAFLEHTEKLVKDKRYQAEAKREKDYVSLYEKANKGQTEAEIQSVITDMTKLSGYKDSERVIADCKSKIVEIKNMEKAESDARKAIFLKKVKNVSIIVAVLAVLVIVGVIGFKIYEKKVIIPDQKYKEACELQQQQKYEEAIKAFEELDGYNDSEDKIAECNAEINNIKEAEEKAEQEKLQKELEKKYQTIISKVDDGDYEGAISDLSGIDEDEKNKIIEYMIEGLCTNYEEVTAINNLSLKDLNKKCLMLLDIVNDEQKEKIISLNDKKCLEVGLSKVSDRKYGIDYSSDYYEMIIDDKYKSDMYTLYKYIGVYDKSLDNGFWDSSFVSDLEVHLSDNIISINIDFSLENHYLYIEFSNNGRELARWYVITGESEYIVVGENTNEGTYKIKANGEAEKLSEPLEQDAETFFDDYLD